MVEKVATVATFVAVLAIALIPNCVSMMQKLTYQPSAAVIICGWSYTGVCEFWGDSYLAYWMMRFYYSLPSDRVVYLAPTMTPEIPFPPNVITALSTKENVCYYLTQWLPEVSDQRDNSVFVYIASHGGGFNTSSLLEDGRWDDDGDEGNEHFSNGEWKGVDEGILLKADNSTYWDDEMRENLTWTLSSPNPESTIMIQNCYNPEISDLTCFSGGFIDDLSSIYRRTVLTSSNETGRSFGRSEWDLSVPAEFSPFTYHFFTSILGYRVHWGGALGIIVEYDHPIDWQYKSLRGGYEYVLQHDGAYLAGKEFPWFDDDGNRLPTYQNNEEVPDFPRNASELLRWLQYDINNDGKVNMVDVATVAIACWTVPGIPRWNKQADIKEDFQINIKDIALVARAFGKTT
jgi:hypothetical protein